MRSSQKQGVWVKIDKNTWHAKLFFWSMRVWMSFKDDVMWDKEVLIKRMLDRGTNLCEYIRVTFLWMPLVVLLHIIFYGMMVAAFLVVPIAFFGMGSYLKTSGLIIGAILGAILVGGTLTFLASELSWHLDKRIRKIKRGEFSGFPKVLSEWAKAKKEKVCPIVQFVESEKESAP